MPVDPRSDLPIRIALACSQILVTETTKPGAFYTHDGSEPGIWHSTSEALNATAARYSNRRMTCFDLLRPAPPNAEGTALQIGSDYQGNTGIIFARCAIHEVIEGWELDLEGKTTSLSEINPREGQLRKIGLELTLNTTTPQTLNRNPDGTVSVLPESVGQSVSWNHPAHYCPKNNGSRLVRFVADYIDLKLVWMPLHSAPQTPSVA